LATDDADRVTAKATIITEVERLHWRTWKAQQQDLIERVGYLALLTRVR
jgi:hypothetical protein